MPARHVAVVRELDVSVNASDASFRRAQRECFAHVAAFRARDERHSAREYSGMTILDAHGRAIGRDRIRRAIDLARLQGMLVLQPLPADECRGARKDFLDVRAAT